MRPSTVPARPALVIGVLASCGLTVSLMQTLVVPLLPQFPRLLSASTATVAWLVTATLVAGAVCAPCSAGSATCTASAGCCWSRSG